MDSAKTLRCIDCEIVATDGNIRARLYPPILGTVCSRCAERVDDVSFVIEEPGRGQSGGGLCGPCVIDLLQTAARGT